MEKKGVGAVMFAMILNSLCAGLKKMWHLERLKVLIGMVERFLFGHIHMNGTASDKRLLQGVIPLK